MSFERQAPRPSKNLDGVAAKRQKIWGNRLSQGSLRQLMCLEELLGWGENAVLNGISFKREKDGWKVVIKAQMRNGPRVAFVASDTLPEALEATLEFVDKGLLTWYWDKYAK
ncbi:MAG: hypothetical protein HKM22_04875 [Gammaproteobacteria bacterium]|nr:hypothetical protein [Gammaproteobacteria bacterium]